MGFKNWSQPFSAAWNADNGPRGQFFGFWTVLMQAFFSYCGSEIAGVVCDPFSSSTQVLIGISRLPEKLSTLPGCVRQSSYVRSHVWHSPSPARLAERPSCTEECLGANVSQYRIQIGNALTISRPVYFSIWAASSSQDFLFRNQTRDFSWMTALPLRLLLLLPFRLPVSKWWVHYLSC